MIDSEDIDVEDIPVTNDISLGFIIRCNSVQREDIIPALQKIFPNIFLVYMRDGELDDKIYIVSEKEILRRRKARNHE